MGLTMTSRRHFLCGGGAVFGGALAGCTSLASRSDDDREYAIRVYNYSDTARTFRIRIGESPLNSFHFEEVELEAEIAGDTISFDGVPGGLTVTVDEGDQWNRWEFPWPVKHGGEAPATRADIVFHPGHPQEIVVRAN